MTPTRMRVGGVLFLPCGATLVGIGTYLFAGVLEQKIPLDGAGLSVVWLWLAGGVTALMGAEMLVFGQRPRWLLWLFVPLMAIFVAVGLWLVLTSGGRVPRFYR